MSDEFRAPKPLIEVQGKSLIWWSLQSFHELLTCGAITKQDIKIAVLRQQINEYRSNHDLVSYFGNLDPFIEIPEVTSGPLETASIAIDYLLRGEQLTLTEQVIFSDSDHFARSVAIRRSLEKVKDLYLWETQKGPGLEWSFLKRSNSTLKIVEKPKTGEGLDTNKGIVGIYGFGAASLFIEYSRKILEKPYESERYMSNVVNLMLDNQLDTEVNEILEFVPMGTPRQIASAINLPNPEFMILDSPNYFVDIDGVLLEHNESIHGQRTWTSDSPIQANIKELNECYKSARIVLVTARPKNRMKEITQILADHSINYDEILAGCTGGIRFLVNDRKPRLPFLDTSVSVNIGRNEKLDLNELNGRIKDISGGSGAKTFLFKNPSPKVVKISKKPGEAEILNYQADWYEFCKNNTNAQTLNVIDRYNGIHGVFGYTTNFRDNLISFENFRQQSEIENWSKILIEGLQRLYFVKDEREQVQPALLPRIIKEKALPSIELAISKSLGNDLLMNELQKLHLKLQKFFTRSALSSMDFRGMKTFIHGDPTFENLQVETQTKELVFIDPVGKMIEGGVKNSESHNFFSFPVFDLARLELSFRLKYEEHINICRNEKIDPTECISLGTASIENLSILGTVISKVFSDYYTGNLEIVLVTTLARILKYKSNPREMLILTTQANLLMDSIL